MYHTVSSLAYGSFVKENTNTIVIALTLTIYML